MKQLFITILFINLLHAANAQDTLVLVTGTKLIVHVKEVDEYYITFFVEDDTLNQTRLPLSRVKQISYFDNKVIYTSAAVMQLQMNPSDLPIDEIEIKLKAIEDARKFYRNYKAAGTGTFFGTMFGTPVLGAVIAIPTSVTPPTNYNLNIALNPFIENQVYSSAYKQEAYRIKKQKIWTNFAIGGLVNVAFAFFIYSSIQNMGVSF